jgi:3-oxoacyl-(acyl-carrier-protein) synthase
VTAAAFRQPLAVTGLGVCGPFGSGTDALWDALCTGQAHRPQISSFDATGATNTCAGALPEPDAGADRWRALDLAERAADDALAGVPASIRRRTALVLGTTDPGLVPPRRGGLAGDLAAECAKRLGLGGEAITVASASASGAVAIAVGRDIVATGAAPVALVGGADAVTDMAFHGLNSLRTLGPEGCRPFSTERRGIGVSEGAAVLRLEPLAERDGPSAQPGWARLLGCGLTNATDHLAAPGAEGIELAIRRALDDAGVGIEEVSFVNAHGPGTRRGDTAEVDALRAVFSSRLSAIPVNSVKGVLWHLQGAAGAIEALACVLSLHHRTVTPTWGAEPVDPAFHDLDLVVDSSPRTIPGLHVGVSVSCGLGGINTALVVGHADG